jgi:hypothetical protein
MHLSSTHPTAEKKNKMTTLNTAPAATETFAEYNAGKLEVVDGRVHLLPAGWAEYGPSFSVANIMLRDKMPLDEFKLGVRAGARAALQANDVAMAAELAKLETPLDDKRFIRELLAPGAATPAAQSAQVLAFPARNRS